MPRCRFAICDKKRRNMFYVFDGSIFTWSESRPTLLSLLKSREVSRVGKMVKALHISPEHR